MLAEVFMPDCPLISISVKSSQFVQAFFVNIHRVSLMRAQNSGKAHERFNAFTSLVSAPINSLLWFRRKLPVQLVGFHSTHCHSE